MKKVSTCCFAVLLFAWTLQSVRAGDEESLGGPYSTFDPETGFYTSGDAESATSRPHSTPPAQTDTQDSNPAIAKNNGPSVPPPNVNPPYLILAAAIVVLVGALFGFRYYRNNSTNH